MPGSQPLTGTFQHYSGFYRPIRSLSNPWVASPNLNNAPSPLPSSPIRADDRGGEQSTPLIVANDSIPALIPATSKRPRDAIARLLCRLADKIGGQPPTDQDDKAEILSVQSTVDKMIIEVDEPEETIEEVPLTEWKAWGYYACPKLHGFHVKNHPPALHIPPDINVEEIYHSLIDESNNTFHPERWIRGLKHPAIPPRPERWKDHIMGTALPFPWKCQLNPLLQHSAFGKPPIDWDIRHRSSRSFIGRTGDVILPLSDGDKAQPATYPFVTHMYIHSLGDDPYPEYFWPFYVVNEHGVTVGDVLDTIYENFQQHLAFSEYELYKNSFTRRQTVTVAFQMRGGDGQQARRVDILGTQCHFRGLEPHPNREGWSMFLGLG